MSIALSPLSGSTVAQANSAEVKKAPPKRRVIALADPAAVPEQR